MNRFWSKVNKHGPIPKHRPELGCCWLWTACKSAKGYGRFMVGGKRVAFAHRFAYELVVGKIPDGEELDHLCRNRSCVRPSHMKPGTHAENMRADGSQVGIPSGMRKLSKTHCPQGHPYSGENLMWQKNGDKLNRRCRTCVSTWNRKQWRLAKDRTSESLTAKR